MKIIESFCTKSDCYKAGKALAVKGVMLHSVGCSQPKAAPFIKTWNKSGVNVCVHAIVEPDGEVYQLLPWTMRAWHGGGVVNNTHIGVEMTEPATIRYTKGANWEETADGKNTKEHVLAVYEKAVELFAYLCKEYELEPLEDGVIISHAEGHKRGIASNHADVEHLWCKFGLTMNQFREDVKKAMGEETVIMGTEIMGKAKASVEQMQAYIRKVNPKVSKSVIDMIPLFLSEGKAEGVRGDIAFAQSCLETGNFGFKGSAVTLEQNNFCGMGVTRNGLRGNRFATPQEGIRAQIQHLKAYASTEDLTEECIDPRFSYVKRGCAAYVEWLGQKENPEGKGWATGKDYGKKILTILSAICNTKAEEKSDIPYLVRVSIRDLNIRTGPGTNYNKVKYIPIGIYTIVEEAEGKGDSKWGRLKSGVGWISLDYAKKI